MMPIQLQPVITSISPGLGLVGTPKSISIFGQGLTGGNNPGTPSIQLSGTGGMSATITGQSDSQIDINLTSTPGTSAGNAVISVAVNSAASNGESFLVQIPSRVAFRNAPCCPNNGQSGALTVQNGLILDCSGKNVRAPDTTPQCGVYGQITYQLLDQAGSQILDAYQITEQISNFNSTAGETTPNGFTANALQNVGTFCDVQGIADDAPGCLGPNDHHSLTQTFVVPIGGHNYQLSTLVAVVVGFETGNPNPILSVTIKTP